jgi:cellulose synthase/poly-beta-1,6-N-acetylglucosamine synthase-like glycosyltransferase
MNIASWLPLLLAAIGPNMLFWSTIGSLRFMSEAFRASAQPVQGGIATSQIAAVIAAHNEEIALPSCLSAITAILPARQVFIANDASNDKTAEIAKDLGCKVFSARANMGKARVLAAAIARFKLCTKFKAVLILDADSAIDPHYLERGLVLFDDPQVAVVAGHVVSRPADKGSIEAAFVHTYRSRLYFLVQALCKFGQSWKPFNVTYIAPGFASMYRASVLEQLDIAAPGLVIEDFNMTFDVHRLGLGRIAYSPLVRCTTEDPGSIRDYSKQVRRWCLGFWQTLLAHQPRFSLFWLSLFALIVESVFTSLLLLAVPVLVAAHAGLGTGLYLLSASDLSIYEVDALQFLAAIWAADYAVTLAVAVALGNWRMTLFGPGFPFMRFIDAYWSIAGIFSALTTTSDGRWNSPKRSIRTA